MRYTIFMLFSTLFANLACAVLEFDKTENVHHAALLEEKSEAIFRFTNTGTEPVVLMDPVSSCGCTVPKLEKKEYLPGKSGEIRSVFTFGSRVGVQRKRITVKTRSPTEETYLLNMVTHIPGWIEIEPRVLRWKNAEGYHPRQVMVTISNPNKVKLELPVEEFKNFTVEIEGSEAGQYVFTIVPKPLTERATEFIKFTAKVSDKGTTKSRQFGVHCLIR
jgi:hypothetical protein